MRLEEIRDLDGPNLFLNQPALKIELADVPEEDTAAVMLQLSDTVEDLHDRSGVDVPAIVATELETAGHIAVAFGWEHRSFACTLGTLAAQLVLGERTDDESIVSDLRATLEHPGNDDAPLMVMTAGTGVRVIAITGTNGKTTTSRLIAFALRHAGHKVGLTSSAGVYIGTEQVLKGDYSGPSGARRVFAEPGMEYAVLETARGGMLLRGCGYDVADVAVVTNVSEDHLGLHGIHTIDGLAGVKAIVARTVKPEGFCVLNAENRYTLAMKDTTTGVPVLFTKDPGQTEVDSHVTAGGRAIQVDNGGRVLWRDGNESIEVTTLADIPMTFDGRATHQVENALAAIGALIGIGLPLAEIRAALKAFRSTAEDSKGRLNVFSVNGGTINLDFAHNEAGLVHLLNFAKGFLGDDGTLTAIVGTAGDREDSAVTAMSRIAAESADVVVLKDSVHYLRGRQPGDMFGPMRAGILAANRAGLPVFEYPSEREATLVFAEKVGPGDVLAVMCVEDYEYLIEAIGAMGTPVG